MLRSSTDLEGMARRDLATALAREMDRAAKHDTGGSRINSPIARFRDHSTPSSRVAWTVSFGTQTSTAIVVTAYAFAVLLTLDTRRVPTEFAIRDDHVELLRDGRIVICRGASAAP